VNQRIAVQGRSWQGKINNWLMSTEENKLERSITNGDVAVANTTKFSAEEKLFLNAPRPSETKLDDMDNRTLYCVVVAPGMNLTNPNFVGEHTSRAVSN
jgi:hypothetical protein